MASASRHAASSMKSERFLPSVSAARSIRVLCFRFARILMVTSRAVRSPAVELSAMESSYDTTLCIHTCMGIVYTKCRSPTPIERRRETAARRRLEPGDEVVGDVVDVSGVGLRPIGVAEHQHRGHAERGGGRQVARQILEYRRELAVR